MKTPDVPNNIKIAIASLLDYNWNDEERDYINCEDDPRGKHIFEAMVEIHNWLHPEEYEELPKWRGEDEENEDIEEIIQSFWGASK